MDAERFARFLEEKVRAEGVPGLSIAVVKGDRVVWASGFGLADLATSIPATPQTGYLWFSMTKIVTATAVVRLAEEERLDLDAPADEYYRAFKVVSQPVPVSIRHLLGHSSGLANPVPIRWVYPASGPAPDRRAFVERLLTKNRKLRFVPGEWASYSNLGYLVLGEVISEVSGMPYEEYVREEILVPLGVKNQLLVFACRRRGGNGLPSPASFAHPALQGRVAEGRRRTTAREVRGVRPLLRQGSGLRGSNRGRRRGCSIGPPPPERWVGETRMLSAASVAAMQRTTPRGGERDFGLGWFRAAGIREKRPDFVEHLGGGAGFWNVMRLYPEKSFGVVMMGNTTGYDHESILDEAVRATWD